MKHLTTKAIILKRIDFSESDRILALLTKDQGKIRVIAKGVRKMKSKLAGGIELLSVTDITYIQGRSEIHTLVSSRLDEHYSNIVKDINRTMLAYELIKKIDRLTEDSAGDEYFELLCRALQALNDDSLSSELLETWFNLQLLQTTGHAPNLVYDTEDQQLVLGRSYSLDPDDMTFKQHEAGYYQANHIKLLRLASQTSDPLRLLKVKDVDDYASVLVKLTKSMLTHHTRG